MWGDSFCADGYFVECVGVINVQKMKHYIRNQRFGRGFKKPWLFKPGSVTYEINGVYSGCESDIFEDEK